MLVWLSGLSGKAWAAQLGPLASAVYSSSSSSSTRAPGLPSTWVLGEVPDCQYYLLGLEASPPTSYPTGVTACCYSYYYGTRTLLGGSLARLLLPTTHYYLGLLLSLLPLPAGSSATGTGTGTQWGFGNCPYPAYRGPITVFYFKPNTKY